MQGVVGVLVTLLRVQADHPLAVMVLHGHLLRQLQG
jgi:hypothetical protein